MVLVEHGSGDWAAYISTDTTMSVEATLQTVSDRWSIEEHFHDVKEIWGCRRAAGAHRLVEHCLLELVRMAVQPG